MVDFPAPGMPVRQTINFFIEQIARWLLYEGTGNYYKDTSNKIVMRAFVAVEILNKEVIKAIANLQSEISIRAKAVEPENLHFTLQFLGEISDDSLTKIRKSLQTIEFSSFEISFRGVGAFPNMRHPRVVWIGVDDKGGNELKNLANKVENVLSPLGFVSDKPFKSHITVFRIKNKIGDISKKLERFGNQKECFEE